MADEHTFLKYRRRTLKHYRTCRTDSGECFDVMDGHKIVKSFERVEDIDLGED